MWIYLIFLCLKYVYLKIFIKKYLRKTCHLINLNLEKILKNRERETSLKFNEVNLQSFFFEIKIFSCLFLVDFIHLKVNNHLAIFRECKLIVVFI